MNAIVANFKTACSAPVIAEETCDGIQQKATTNVQCGAVVGSIQALDADPEQCLSYLSTPLADGSFDHVALFNLADECSSYVGEF